MALTTLTAVTVAPEVAAAAGPYSFSMGVFEPRQLKTTHWNNANSDAYAPTLEAVVVDDPDAHCWVTLLRTWYVRQPSGEKEFYLTVQGDTQDRCQVRVYLAGFTKYRESSIGVLAPGQSWRSHWNNAHTDQVIYLVGVLGEQTAAGACAVEVTTRYRTNPDGENEFDYEAVNVGSVACSAKLLHVSVPVTESHYVGGAPPGGYVGVQGTIGPDGTRIVVVGAVPQTDPDGPCEFSPEPMEFFELGAVSADFRNTGSVSCWMTATFATM